MENCYTDEKNVQILVALFKAHGIKRAILSPGSANSPLVASLQRDDFFECYSCVDERSAAYMACGFAEESNEPVIISCTGATASRNYFPGMTEAYYRKLPVIAVTSTQPVSCVGQNIAQVVDRSIQPNDSYSYSVTLPIIKDDVDRWDCELKVNAAIAALVKKGGGNVHLNLQTNSLRTYTTKELPKVRKINYYSSSDELPEFNAQRVAIIIGSRRGVGHADDETIDRFCELNNGVVFCDHTSAYKGKYSVNSPLIGTQHLLDLSPFKAQVTIHIGEVSGDYYSAKLVGETVWRVSPDGEFRDTYKKLVSVCEMSETDFFEYYSKGRETKLSYYEQLEELSSRLSNSIPELPFSNIYIASVLSAILPPKMSDSLWHFKQPKIMEFLYA